MRLNHPKPSPCPGPWKNCLLRNRSLVPKRLGTAVIKYKLMKVVTYKAGQQGKKWKEEFSE